MPFMSRKKFDSTQKGPPRLKSSMGHKSSTSIRFHSIPFDLDLTLKTAKGFSAPCTVTQSLHTLVQQRRHSRGKRKKLAYKEPMHVMSQQQTNIIFCSMFSYIGLYFLSSMPLKERSPTRSSEGSFAKSSKQAKKGEKQRSRNRGTDMHKRTKMNKNISAFSSVGLPTLFIYCNHPQQKRKEKETWHNLMFRNKFSVFLIFERGSSTVDVCCIMLPLFFFVFFLPLSCFCIVFYLLFGGGRVEASAPNGGMPQQQPRQERRQEQTAPQPKASVRLPEDDVDATGR